MVGAPRHSELTDPNYSHTLSETRMTPSHIIQMGFIIPLTFVTTLTVIGVHILLPRFPKIAAPSVHIPKLHIL